MNNLEEQADNAKARELFWKPLSWLGAIRPTSANDAFDPALWETFVSTTLDLALLLEARAGVALTQFVIGTAVISTHAGP
jgi:hypothetical protein